MTLAAPQRLTEMQLQGNAPMVTSAAIYWPSGGSTVAAQTPIAFGISLPQGTARAPIRCRLELPDGRGLPGQATVLGCWPDGSARWLLIDAVVAAGTELSGAWQTIVENGHDDNEIGRITAGRDDRSIVVTNEQMLVRFAPTGSIRAWRRHDAGDLDTKATASAGRGRGCLVGQLPELTDARGQVHAPRLADMRIISSGPVRATIEILATFPRAGGLRLNARWSFYRESNIAIADITLHNPRRARHRGGMWDLGDPGSILFRDFSVPISFEPRQKTRVLVRSEAGQAWHDAGSGDVEIYQESSGGRNWNGANHLNREGVVPLRFCGYRGRVGDRELAGQRATPTIEIAAGQERLVATIAEFWQQFPNAIEVGPQQLWLRLFPRQFGDLHELQGGEQKTHKILLQFTDAADAAIRVEDGAGLQPHNSQPAATDDLVCLELPRRQAVSLQPGAIAGLPNWDEGEESVLARLDELAEEFLSGPRGVYATRERVDNYGWRNYGEFHADHEELHYHGPQPLVSHYNNQFDLLSGLLLQYSRTADARWMDLADLLARHVIDIDIYRTTEDRPAYCGGLFWFTDHYLHAHTSTHRTYSAKNKVPGQSYGGGPGSAHNFTTGLLLYHLATGCPQARAAVCGLADWVIAMDDGSRSLLGFLDDGPSGLATPSNGSHYDHPERGAGNSLSALLDGWLLTQDRKYLSLAERIVCRCIHPRDDLHAMNLLDAERCWSYTVFLVALDKYLRCKLEVDELDATYHYARCSLLHYGSWMLHNERPYLDNPQNLEYPTEAWAAQEIRKANALRLAAQYATPPLANAMFDRGDKLADRAWADLAAFKTRTTLRAMAVILTEGVRDAELRRRESRFPLGAPAVIEFPAPQRFESQRRRISRKLRSPAGILSLLVNAANPHRWPRLFNHW